MILSNNSLKELQKIEREVLDVVDKFCRDNEIRYSLAYGTLLGAVRHGGFIPWDDDIDLMMLRTDYDKFICCWEKNPPEGYFLVEKNIYPSYPQNFLKIRKAGTTAIEVKSEYVSPRYPLGVYIDIFPFDRAAPDGFQRKLQYYSCLINMLLTRNYVSGNAGLIGLIEKLVLSFPERLRNRFLQKSKRYIERWNLSAINTPLINYCTYEYASLLFPSDMFDSIIEISFDGKRYSAVEKYDEVLRISYGDYLILPPEEERKAHPHFLLDLEKDYFLDR